MEEIKKVEGVTESPVTPTAEAEQNATPTSYERQAMTRRQALGRLGFLAGAAAVAALGVDDLTRLVGKEMERRVGDDKTARKVAQEFSNAGVAFASPSEPPPCRNPHNGSLSCAQCRTGSGCTACCEIVCASTPNAACYNNCRNASGCMNKGG
jgi:hypothetical protein